jgi:hypothetical protein
MSMVAVSMMVNLVAEAESHHNELPMPAVMFGVIAAVIFATLGFVMFSYRDVANRRPDASSSSATQHGGADAHGHDSTASGH